MCDGYFTGSLETFSGEAQFKKSPCITVSFKLKKIIFFSQTHCRVSMLSVAHFKLSANQISRKCYEVEALFVKIVSKSFQNEILHTKFSNPCFILPLTRCVRKKKGAQK